LVPFVCIKPPQSDLIENEFELPLDLLTSDRGFPFVRWEITYADETRDILVKRVSKEDATNGVARLHLKPYKKIVNINCEIMYYLDVYYALDQIEEMRITKLRKF